MGKIGKIGAEQPQSPPESPLSSDEQGRFRVDLFRLPRWMVLFIALAIVALVVLLARWAEPNPKHPAWLPDAIYIGGWVYVGLVVIAVVGWAMRVIRKHG